MRRMTWIAGLFSLLAVVAAGCGGVEGPQLAPASGTVTYNGKPLEGANVSFMPSSGPVAYGATDAKGEFTLSTGGEPGAMVGSGTVLISAYQELDTPKKEEELTAEDLRKMSQSRIPEKYGRPETSGLSATIPPEGKKDLRFELTD